ncbi:MAG: hypothetical protein ACE5FN_03165 [Leptospirillia bacterium]
MHRHLPAASDGTGRVISTPDTSAAPDRTRPSALNPEALSDIGDALVADGVREYAATGARHFRVGAHPYYLSAEQVAFFEALGPHLLSFYRALDLLYRRAHKGLAPGFVADWMDRGKPEEVLRLARMGRFKRAMPAVIRPDVFFTDDGPRITELDSVPGGIGLTDALNHHYAAAGCDVVGGADGMTQGFAEALFALTDEPDPVTAIVVSDESGAYRDEMRHMALRLRTRGISAHVLHPSEVMLDDAGLFLVRAGERCGIDVLYRFFEMFDLANVAGSEPMLTAAKKRQVAMTPPPKPQLEEKLAMALFHHPALFAYWRQELGEAGQAFLSSVLPRTWVMDPTPVPPHAVIPGLAPNGVPLQGWDSLKGLGQKARRMVIKPSGFSEMAWGGRGVVIGHDMQESEWDAAVDAAVENFSHSPHVLQPFHKPKRVSCSYLAENGIARMGARARLCPYYFVADDRVKLGGILATVCPEDKKRIHGMTDAVMIPCAPPRTRDAGER